MIRTLAGKRARVKERRRRRRSDKERSAKEGERALCSWHGSWDDLAGAWVLLVWEWEANEFWHVCYTTVDVVQKKDAPLIVFAGVPNADVHQELLNHPLHRNRVVLTVQRKAYCDERMMLDWIDEVWGPEASNQRLLLLDSLKTYKMASARAKLEEDYCSEVEFVLPGITGLAQPMDVSIVLLAWESIEEKRIARGFVNAGFVPIGPREADGTFRVPEPTSESVSVEEEEESETE
ncbi:hypothetical protein PHYSODRAFT_334608 [Phytophthora sojae]|uniref:DDE-1 domain-containing protein n=1 Tax=Phytophthora sojae (strain P6497) TaxID=1094619 RepID=G4ZKQ1_PHYSP|nr:hypothetical protein PHYSODRAFT_334608 [Phytophthora sojae]EGZ16421.1 hypothetical protein PHYSODRAFT_334608 [Phytophthora sojae]|eukprot:XP_009530170.1 hypothetical protein PHYSODRAFT_334608 [Phytophthora sojae]